MNTKKNSTGAAHLKQKVSLRLIINNKKKNAHNMLPAGKTHTETHTLLSVSCTTFPTSLDWADEAEEPHSPCRECALLGVVLHSVSFAPLGAGSVVIFSLPAPHTPCSTWRTPGHHESNVLYNCCLVQPKQQPHVYASVSKPCIRLKCCGYGGTHDQKFLKRPWRLTGSKQNNKQFNVSLPLF